MTQEVNLSVTSGGATGTFDGDIALSLWRNAWKDKGATDVLAPYVGVYTVQLASSETGTGYLSLTLDAKGTSFVVDAGSSTKPVQDKVSKTWSYAGENDASLTFGFTQATGIFKGKFTCWYDYLSSTDNTKDPATEEARSRAFRADHESAGEDASGTQVPSGGEGVVSLVRQYVESAKTWEPDRSQRSRQRMPFRGPRGRRSPLPGNGW